MLDYGNVLAMLSDEERQVQSTARDFLESEAAHDIADWWERGEFPLHLVPKLGDLGPYGKQVVQFYTQTKTITERWFDENEVGGPVNTTINLK